MSERLAPSAILLQTNLVGTVSAITDDPDAPDGSWLTASNDGNDTDLRVSFPTPSGPLIIGAGLQNFRAYVRSTGGGDDPSATVYLYENGVLRATGSAVAISSTTGQIISFAWNASLLTDPTGAGVECRIFGNAAGGILDPDDTVETGAVEWNAEVTEVKVGQATGAAGSSGSASGAAEVSSTVSGAGGSTGFVQGATDLGEAAAGASGSTGSAQGESAISDGTIGHGGSAGSAQGIASFAGAIGGDGGSAGYVLGVVELASIASGSAGSSGSVIGQAVHASVAAGDGGSAGSVSREPPPPPLRRCDPGPVPTSLRRCDAGPVPSGARRC